MGRRGGLVGILGAIACAAVDTAIKASRQAEAERNRQLRAAESYRNKQLLAAERDRQKQIRAEENEKRKIGNSAQRLANMVNKSIEIARDSPNLTTKLHKLNTAQHIIAQLRNMAEQYSYLTLYDIVPIESEIMQMKAEVERNQQNMEIEKTTLAAEKRQRERDKKRERQQRQTEKLAEQKNLKRLKLADSCVKDKVRIEADKIKEKQATKDNNDKLAHHAAKYF